MAAADPQLSVVIATHNRAAKLGRCLDALAAQDPGAPFEALVVDDGSTDDTAQVMARHAWVTALRSEHHGRGGARNPAVERARAPLILFLDDDVVPGPGLLGRHLEHHGRHPDPHEALVGLVTWAPELAITPHMLWLEDGGPLFSFNTISDAENVDWRHFCTANVSLKRRFLPSTRPFDPTLERCVDVELGYRLARQGMRLRYDSAARVDHLRIDTPETTAARMRSVGRAMRIVHHKHPELAEDPPPFRRLSHLRARLARPVAPLLRRIGVPQLEERLFSYDSALAFTRGYTEDATVIDDAAPAPAGALRASA